MFYKICEIIFRKNKECIVILNKAKGTEQE